jgi:hypothetical protein
MLKMLQDYTPKGRGAILNCNIVSMLVKNGISAIMCYTNMCFIEILNFSMCSLLVINVKEPRFSFQNIL